MLELFLALSTAWICVVGLCTGLSAPAWSHSLLLLLSPLGLGALGRFILGSLWPGQTWKKVCLSQSSLQGMCLSPLTVLALSLHTRDRLCTVTHPLLESWLRAAVCQLYGMLCSNVWYPATVTLQEKHHRHLVCASQASAPSGK